MTESNSSASILLLSLPNIYATSEETRVGVVSALTAISAHVISFAFGPFYSFPNSAISSRPLPPIVSVPVVVQNDKLPRPSSSPLGNSDITKSSASTSFSLTGSICRRPLRIGRDQNRSQKSCDYWYCSCGFRSDAFYSNQQTNLSLVTKDGHSICVDLKGICKYHFKRRWGADYQDVLYCPVCYKNICSDQRIVRYTPMEIRTHLEKHTRDELGRARSYAAFPTRRESFLDS